jgi:antirestriction protein ArdC
VRAESRINRELKGRYEQNAYAFEELVAEIGAAMVCATLGVVQSKSIPENHIKYVKGWLEIMKGDNKAIISAAQAAQKAVDLILPQDKEEKTD